MFINKPLTLLDFRDPAEVSVVDEAANNRKFLIWKNKEWTMPTPEEILQAVIEQQLGDEKNLEAWVSKAKLSEKGAAAVKAAVRILGGFKDELPADILTKLSELTGMAGPPTAPVAKKEPKQEPKQKPKPEPKPTPVSKALEGLPVEVQKALDAKDAARDLEIKTLTENNVLISKALSAETDRRELAGWVEKAKTELSHYPGESTEEIAKSLHQMHKVDPELASSQFETMKKASDALKGSAILKNAGSSRGVAAGSAWETIEKLAGGIVEKSSDSAMTKARAITHVLQTEQGQELYTQYEKEQEGA